ncbi:MAG: hypothetical protein GOVbin4206_110 [Prokaryotic dsDNA virus sp.]|nr:MAG: hypothetical protein GOVbin4206_110 [Prokaryotic dsDNA virus sp.]|tara:strand:- start:3258 stop:4715 length:1458 start_codon:yes stop_codon:yes gene_type:complete
MNEDINIEELAELVDIPEEYHGLALEEKMPRLVEDWKRTVLTVSHKNDIPAMASFFSLLGQITKDFIRIPRGKNTEDSRIHFCWMQTSGTGKSTLWNFMGPVSKSLHKKINDFEGTSGTDSSEVYIPRKYNNFDVVEYTDAALIGFYERLKELDENDEPVFERRSGSLEGNGLAHWDEFEYSGVFKQSQHKENIIVYLNTLMNTLEGESWIITKKLKEGHLMECMCQRSVWATTYIPKHLKSVIAEKGVLQRMLVYVREVPEEEQHEMRMLQLRQSGKREVTELDTERFAKSLFSLYKNVKARFLEVGEDPFSTVTYSEGFADALVNEYMKMREYIKSCRPEIREIAQNFMTRINVQLLKLSVLCCIAERKFVVTPTHVRQAYILTQQCYSTLVEWLERSLKIQKSALVQNKSVVFVQEYNGMVKDGEVKDNGYVSKPKLFERVQKKGISRAQCYRDWKIIENKFEIDTVNRSVFVRLKKGDDEK